MSASIKRTSSFFDPPVKLPCYDSDTETISDEEMVVNPLERDIRSLQLKVQSFIPSLEIAWSMETAPNYLADFYHSLKAYATYSHTVFSAIITHKAGTPSRLEWPDPEIEPYEEDEYTTLLSLEERRSFETLAYTIDELFTYLLRLKELTDMTAEIKECNQLTQCAVYNHKHYQKKIPELDTLPFPENLIGTSWSDLPKARVCDRIHRIGQFELYQKPEVQEVLNPLLSLARKAYNNFRKATFGRSAVLEFLKFFRETQHKDLTEIHNLRHKQLAASERQAELHYKKMMALACKQQKRLHLKPHRIWGRTNPDNPPFRLAVGKCAGFNVAYASAQGPRGAMEDRIVIEEMEITLAHRTYLLPLFAVMDGHGGAYAAEHCMLNLGTIFAEELARFNPTQFSADGFYNAARTTCLRLHQTFSGESGTTLIFSTCILGVVMTVNLGDSRGLLLYGSKIYPLNYEATMQEPSLHEKVRRCGAEVVFSQNSWRIKGKLGLNVASSIGDKYDELYLTQVPTITAYPLKGESTLVLCSDGLSGAASDIQIWQTASEAKTPEATAHCLMQGALGATSDNVAIIVAHLQGS